MSIGIKLIHKVRVNKKYVNDFDPNFSLKLLDTAIFSGCYSYYCGGRRSCFFEILKIIKAHYQNKRVFPYYFWFSRSDSFEDLEDYKILHDLGKAYDHGISGLIKKDHEFACELYTKAVISYLSRNDDEYSSFDYIILVNSLSVSVFKHMNDYGLQLSYNNLLDVTYKIASIVIKEWQEKGKNLKKAPNVLEYIAKNGNSNASLWQYNLAINGKIYDNNDRIITKIVKQTADTGLNSAELEYAQRLYSGRGIKADQNKAKKWFLKAAAVWFDCAMEPLADYYKEKADAGDQDGILRYGHCLEHGL